MALDRLEILQSYVPGLIQQRLLRVPQLPREPVAEPLSAALMFADISGFTALTEKLAAEGERGAEEMQRILNQVFGRQIDLIHQHGGDVWGFAGDATLALWSADGGDLAEAVQRASQCGLAVQEALGGIAVLGDTRLNLRTVVGAGAMQLAIVGGHEGRWHAILAGPPLDAIGAALQSTGPGDISLSPEAWNAVRLRCEGESLPDGGGRLGRITQPLPVTASVPVTLPEECEAALSVYVPRSVRARLDAGQLDWLAEFRRLTAMFVNLEGLDSRRPDFLGTLQRAVRCVQEVVYRFGGSINQVMVDDKGTIVVAAWGVAQHTHEHDAIRGTLAAVAAEAELRALGLGSAIGLATGRAFTGTRGNARRLEYAVIGDTVNLAARLMEAADPILCDASTRADAVQRLLFEELPLVSIKGRRSPVSVYRPLAESRRRASDDGKLVGRERETGVLFQALDALASGRAEQIVLVEGEPGIGKSRLVAELVERARPLTVCSLLGAGDAIEQSSPYYAWRAIFSQLLGLEATTEPNLQRQRVASLIAAKPEFEGRASLLNPVLPVEFPESELVAEMSPKARAETARHLLLQLFRAAVNSRPTMLMVDDAQWLDSASWALADAVHRQVRPVLLVLVARIAEEERTEDFRRFVGRDGIGRLQLGRLSRDEMVTLVCQRIGASSLPDTVVKLIWEKAEGHPLFSEELAYVLRDRHLIRIDNGACSVSAELGALDAVRFPDTVQGVVTHRIDNLALPQQLTLKVASVLGRTFELGVLREVHPVAEDRAGLEQQLHELTRLDLVRFAAPEPERTYTFKHAITQEVAYGLLPFAQRRRLHRAVAEWFEKGSELAAAYALLAYHWKNAEVPEKALEYLDKAGEQALNRDYANERAVRFLTEAIELDTTLGQPDNTLELRRARRYRQLGEAYFNLAKYAEGHTHLERTLSLLGRPLPGSRWGEAANLLTAVVRQAWHRLAHSINRRAARGQSPSLLEAARAFSRLGSIYYVTERKAPFISSLVSALNVAELAEPTPELALAYANMGNVAGHIPMHALARAYVRLALTVADQVNRPATTAMVLTRTSIYRGAMCDWQVLELLERSMEIADRLNNSYQWEESATILAGLTYHRGRFGFSADLGGRIYQRATQSATPIHQMWGLAARAQSLLRLGRADEAVELAEMALGLLANSDSALPDVAIWAHGILATARIRQGKLDLAGKAAGAIEADSARSSGVGYLSALGLSGLAEVYLTQWERGPTSAGIPEAARQACQALRRYARRYRSALPGALLWRGWSDWLAGHRRRAHRAWRRSLMTAERLSMPYDQGLAHYEIARHLDPQEPAHSDHLRRATEIFAGLGAAYDLGRARDLARSGSTGG